jgi:predicted choloylglycine hydrolase
MRTLRLLALFLAIALGSCATRTQPKKLVELPPEPAFPAPIVELRGTPEEIGATHAQQLRDPIRQLFDAYLGKYFQSTMQRNIALMAATAFEPHLVPDHRAEIHALAKGVDIDQRQIMLGQCFLDLSAMTACSTVTLPASASPDGVARFGRNLDFPSFNVADKQSVLMIFHPKDRYSFASIAWPGMVGVLSGMNEHGLTLANMEVDRGQRLPVAMPYTLLYRTILEKCKSVNEAITLLESTPRQTANNLMLMDAAGDRAVIEITPEAVTVRRARSNEALISTNHHRGVDLNAPGRCRRFDYLHDTSAKDFGHIDRQHVQGMLGQVAQGKMTLQSMVFEPSNRVLYLAVGAQATSQPYHRLDLKTYFK